MFNARRRIPSNRLYNKTDLERLGQNLVQAGFDTLTVKLPHNLVGIEGSEISFQEFLNRERNYPSVILCAVNVQQRETLKVLFVNISAKAFFVDDTFPSGHSELAEIFVQSPDPARLYGLIGFFADYFNQAGRRTPSVLARIAFAIAPIIAIVEVLAYAKTGQGFFSPTYPVGWVIDLILFSIAIVIMFKSFGISKGLYVKEKPTRSIPRLAKLALQGEAMDNPLVTLVVTVLSAIITALILKWVGLL